MIARFLSPFTRITQHVNARASHGLKRMRKVCNGGQRKTCLCSKLHAGGPQRILGSRFVFMILKIGILQDAPKSLKTDALKRALKSLKIDALKGVLKSLKISALKGVMKSFKMNVLKGVLKNLKMMP